MTWDREQCLMISTTKDWSGAKWTMISSGSSGPAFHNSSTFPHAYLFLLHSPPTCPSPYFLLFFSTARSPGAQSPRGQRMKADHSRAGPRSLSQAMLKAIQASLFNCYLVQKVCSTELCSNNLLLCFWFPTLEILSRRRFKLFVKPWDVTTLLMLHKNDKFSENLCFM